MINYVLGLFSFDLGIDLGTANTLVYVYKKGIAMREPSVVARNRKTREIVAIGKEASKMMGRTGNQLEVFRPLKGGVIADFQGASALLSYCIHKVHARNHLASRLPRPRVIIGIPSGITDVEKKAVIEVALKSGARKVHLVEEALAASVGCLIPVADDHAHAIIDIGGGTTDIAFITGGKITIGVSIKTAGDAMDEAIAHYVKLKYSLFIGQPTAELTKITLADAAPGKEVFHVVRGRDLESGLPKSVRLTNFEVHEALSPLFDEIASTVSELLQESPPELVSDVMQSGIVLTGGGALIRNLGLFLKERLDIDVSVSDDPLTSVVRGVGKLLTERRLLRAVEYKSNPLFK